MMFYLDYQVCFYFYFWRESLKNVSHCLQIYDFNRDLRDIGIAQFTTRYFVLRNCLPNAKCDTVLSAWNPPPEWGE